MPFFIPADEGDALGCCPNPLGDFIPLLRFAPVCEGLLMKNAFSL